MTIRQHGLGICGLTVARPAKLYVANEKITDVGFGAIKQPELAEYFHGYTVTTAFDEAFACSFNPLCSVTYDTQYGFPRQINNSTVAILDILTRSISEPCRTEILDLQLTTALPRPTLGPAIVVTNTSSSTTSTPQICRASSQYTHRILVFTSNPFDRWGIFTINADGTNQRRLTSNDERSPSWSPDEAQINFAVSRGLYWQINVMNKDGTEQHALIDDQSDSLMPDWSPDGKQIAFVSDRNGDTWEIALMTATGTNLRLLTHNTANDSMPDWSPDGKQIAFVSDRDGHNEIYVMNADGTNQHRLTFSSGNSLSPDWSPNGKYIAFSSDDDGNSEIYIMNPDGSNQRRITYNNVYDGSPNWASDSEHIAFSSGEVGKEQVFLMGLDGCNASRLTDGKSRSLIGAWSQSN